MDEDHTLHYNLKTSDVSSNAYQLFFTSAPSEEKIEREKAEAEAARLEEENKPYVFGTGMTDLNFLANVKDSDEVTEGTDTVMGKMYFVDYGEDEEDKIYAHESEMMMRGQKKKSASAGHNWKEEEDIVGDIEEFYNGETIDGIH